MNNKNNYNSMATKYEVMKNVLTRIFTSAKTEVVIKSRS